MRKTQIMSSQYYTPTPEDFRRGFEFEFYYPAIGQWAKEVFDGAGNSFCCEAKLEAYIRNSKGRWEDHVRVPYLTADQIEAEGWVRERQTNIFHYHINALCEWRLWFEPDMRTISIDKSVMDDTNDMYNGSCRCINDFRLICKLLNIK